MKTMECAICGREIIRKKAKRRFCIECLERRQVRNLKVARNHFRNKLAQLKDDHKN